MTDGGPRIAIIGAGPSGTRAAETLVRHGHRPTVFDESPRSGGQSYRRQPHGFRRKAQAIYGFEARKAAAVHAAFDAILPMIDYRPDTLVWNIAGRTLFSGAPAEPYAERFDEIIIATGAMDRVLPIPGWTLPGVFSLGGAQVALKYQGCVVGERPLFVGTGPLLYLVAWQYLKAGVRPAAVVDTAPFRAKVKATVALGTSNPAAYCKGLWFYGALRRRGVSVYEGARPIRFIGGARLESMEIAHRGGQVTIDGDAAGFGFGLSSEAQLADLAGCRFAWNAAQRQQRPQRDADFIGAPGIRLIGDGAAILGADAAETAGELAGLLVAEAFGAGIDRARLATLRRKMRRFERFQDALATAFPVPASIAAEAPDDCVVCRCENVTAGEIRDAARRQDFRDVNHVKSATRLGMGPCQGRLCGSAAAEIAAAAAKIPPQSAGRLRSQPPIRPIVITP